MRLSSSDDLTSKVGGYPIFQLTSKSEEYARGVDVEQSDIDKYRFWILFPVRMIQMFDHPTVETIYLFVIVQ